MAFHRFLQLPVELRQQIWEYAVHEPLLVREQKPVCRMVEITWLPRPNWPQFKLVTRELLALESVCLESRDVLRRCVRLDISHDLVPDNDVVYVEDFCDWRALTHSEDYHLTRHLAISSKLCYDTLKIRRPSLSAFDELGWPNGGRRTSKTDPVSRVFAKVVGHLPNLESITVVFPPLEKDMPYFADRFPLSTRPCVLKPVSSSETQNIRIRGHNTYTTSLRGGVNTERRYLGSFVKDVNEVWRKELERAADDDDPRRGVTVQAGVLQYFEGPCFGKRKLTSIYKAT